MAGTSSLHRITSGTRLLGYVSIDSTVSGRARGGLRIALDVCEEELRADAHAMTLKYGLLGLPQGGAKAGIIGDGDAPAGEKRALLHDFARAAGALLRERAYVPDADVGTTASDIRWMMESVGLRVAPREWRANRSGDHTARSCVASAQVLCERGGSSLAGCSVAVEGFGKVGSSAALLLHQRGATVVAISTSRGALYRADGLDVDRLVRRAAQVGSRVVEDGGERLDRAALLELPVDVLVPCARFRSIRADNVARVAARAIAAGANNPVSPEAEDALLERGISFPPDFVTNAGGVLGGTLEFAGVSPRRIGAIVEERARHELADILDRAQRSGATPRAVAEADALERHARLSARAEHPGLGGRLQAVALEAYRRRIIPKRLVSPVAARYVARRST